MSDEKEDVVDKLRRIHSLEDPTAEDICQWKAIYGDPQQPESFDLHSGLPFVERFSQSPFLRTHDYVQFVDRFEGIEFDLHYAYTESGQQLYVCKDFRDSVDTIKGCVTLFPPYFSDHLYSLEAISGLIKEALWAGYPSSPCDVAQFRTHLWSLRKADFFLATPVTLQMLIHRDCIEAYKVVIEVFGGNDYPGTNHDRCMFFRNLQTQLSIWRGHNIKNYLHEEVTKNKGALHPTKKYLRKKGIDFGWPPYEIPVRNSVIDSISARVREKELVIIHCPFQRYSGRGYSCDNLSVLRFYGFTPQHNINKIFRNYPVRDFIM